jgi:hypothetical protein
MTDVVLCTDITELEQADCRGGVALVQRAGMGVWQRWH